MRWGIDLNRKEAFGMKKVLFRIFVLLAISSWVFPASSLAQREVKIGALYP
jgi:hypothetical protein